MQLPYFANVDNHSLLANTEIPWASRHSCTKCKMVLGSR